MRKHCKTCQCQKEMKIRYYCGYCGIELPEETPKEWEGYWAEDRCKRFHRKETK